MVMDVTKILSSYGIEFVESGKNVAKGNVNIQCPWCGDSDHSHHLGINLATGMWGCWRSKQHRGRKFYKLLSKAAGISVTEARVACGQGRDRVLQPDSMQNAVQALRNGPQGSNSDVSPNSIELSANMRPLFGKTRSRAASKFLDYLWSFRGFCPTDLIEVCERYKLHYCIKGDFEDRIIIPVYENKKLMTYLGRSIFLDGLRYRALEKEKSVKQVKDCIYNFDRALKGGRILILVEGAFDCMKMDFYTNPDVVTVGLFNMNVEDSQLELLYQLKDLFDKFVILLDRGEQIHSLNLKEELFFLRNAKVESLKTVKDPGEFLPEEVGRFVERFN